MVFVYTTKALGHKKTDKNSPSSYQPPKKITKQITF